MAVGFAVGLTVTFGVGLAVGLTVAFGVGLAVGLAVASVVGSAVGEGLEVAIDSPSESVLSVSSDCVEAYGAEESEMDISVLLGAAQEVRKTNKAANESALTTKFFFILHPSILQQIHFNKIISNQKEVLYSFF